MENTEKHPLDDLVDFIREQQRHIPKGFDLEYDLDKYPNHIQLHVKYVLMNWSFPLVIPRGGEAMKYMKNIERWYCALFSIYRDLLQIAKRYCTFDNTLSFSEASKMFIDLLKCGNLKCAQLDAIIKTYTDEFEEIELHDALGFVTKYKYLCTDIRGYKIYGTLTTNKFKGLYVMFQMDIEPGKNPEEEIRKKLESHWQDTVDAFKTFEKYDNWFAIPNLAKQTEYHTIYERQEKINKMLKLTEDIKVEGNYMIWGTDKELLPEYIHYLRDDISGHGKFLLRAKYDFYNKITRRICQPTRGQIIKRLQV